MTEQKITDCRKDRLKIVLKVNGIPLDARTREAIEQLIPNKLEPQQ